MSQVATSSTPTLWATASKEWVIPPKPKPGRKPKKEAVPIPTTETFEVDTKERRVQNREAQRAFRERKQSQLAELQAKVQKYEQGEIERTVALQTIAKKLKAENDTLREENARLLAKIQTSGTGTATLNKKRPTPHSAEVNLPLKKSKLNVMTQRSVSPMLSSVSSPEASETGNSPFNDTPSPADISSHPGMAAYHERLVQSWQSLDCGLCSNNTPCACRDLGLKDGLDPPLEFSKDAFVITFSDEPRASSSSILDNPPSFQPAVPLRRRSGRSGVNNLFPVFPALDTTKRTFACTGDPSDCVACANDSFGKAFCTALSEKSRCDSCPQNCGNSSSTVPALSNAPCKASFLNEPISTSERSSEAVRTDDAWHQLKSHPNVAFTDLEMLADVVARRSRCVGPSVGSSTSGKKDFSSQEKPVLVPEEVLLKCNKPPICTVDAAGVRDALRLLDAKFSRTWE